MTLRTRVFLRLSIGLSLVVALLFVPAGTWRFWQGWVLLAIAFPTALAAFVYYYKHDRQFLERRMQTKENRSEQKLTVRLVKLVAFLSILLPGFDHRFGWTRRLFGPVPLWLEVLALAVVLTSYLLVIWVFTVNRFASRTIQVEPNQSVISTGPYHVVRHPMYLATLLMWIAIPISLGSFVALPAFLLLIPTYVMRILDEEKCLRRELPGYPEYCLHTPFRLPPHLW